MFFYIYYYLNCIIPIVKPKNSQHPDFELVPLLENSYFIFRRFLYDKLDVGWHSHPEYEITHISNVSGKRIVGNNLSDFKTGDLTLIGPSLPHLFKEENHVYDSSLKADCLVIQFSHDLFDHRLLSFNDLYFLKSLFERAKFGIAFHGKTVLLAKRIMTKIERQHGLERFIGFFRLLGILAESSEYVIINKEAYYESDPVDSEKDKIIYNYILDHYTSVITIDQIAKLSNLSKGAFCNYFKKKTKKRFSEFINELRCDLACRLLAESDNRISDIAHKVGYENLSYFNRVFIERTKISPSQYRKEYHNAKSK
jgi:AraC-like DNA-binding protein